MDTPVIEKEISKEVDLEMRFENKKVKLVVNYEGRGAGAEVAVYVDAVYFIDLLADAIPGTLDDVVLEMLKGAL